MKKNFLPPSYWRYKKGPDLNLVPQSTICSYDPDNINFSIRFRNPLTGSGRFSDFG